MKKLIETVKRFFGFEEQVIELREPRNEAEYQIMHQTALELYREREMLQRKLNAAAERIYALESRERVYKECLGGV